eukprot:4853749-Pyramimonas_sp.AAC.1
MRFSELHDFCRRVDDMKLSSRPKPKASLENRTCLKGTVAATGSCGCGCSAISGRPLRPIHSWVSTSISDRFVLSGCVQAMPTGGWHGPGD